MPKIGLGIWKISKETCADAVYNAIKAGYRLIDSACDYGNEVEAGEGIARAIYEGIVKREDLFIVSKLWNTYHQPQHVKPAMERTLKDLKLDYVDLYLIHFPISLKFVPFEKRYPPEWKFEEEMELDMGVTYEQTWHAMEALQEAKLTKNIGACNIGTDKLLDVCKYAKIKPAVLQIELHPFNTQKNLVRWAQELDIQVMAFSCLGSLSYLEMQMATMDDTCMLNPAVLGPADKYKKTAAQVVLRWGVQRNTTIIPKTIKPERLAENIAIFDFELTADEMRDIDMLNKNKRFNDPGFFAEAAFGKFCPIYE